jgi:hypothetical protein
MTTFICIHCAEPKPVTDARRSKDSFPTICQSCHKRLLCADYQLICPQAYRRTETSLLPAVARERMASVLDWTYGPKGLLLWGKTSGAGKTRCMWLLVKRLMTLEGIRVTAFDSVGLAHEMERRYRSDLFLDDITRSKWTERFTAELFGLIDRRCAAELPILTTMNESGADLEARKGVGQWSVPIVRRLRDCCEAIEF